MQLYVTHAKATLRMESRFAYMGIEEVSKSLLLCTAAAGAACAASAAGAPVGAANALFTALFGLVNIPTGQSGDANDHQNNNNINGIHFDLLSLMQAKWNVFQQELVYAN